MRYFKFSWLAAFLFCGVILFGCGESTTETETPKDTGPNAYEMISKSWRLNRLQVNDPNIPPTIMGNSSFTFNSNGRYEILMGSLERGVWSLSADAKILITTDDSTRQEKHIDIEKLTPDMLVLYNNEAATPLRMELVPIK